MSRFQLACYVPTAVGDAFVQSARGRGLTVAAALRQLVLAEIYLGMDAHELQRNVLFQTVALDGLLASHPDAGLRSRVLTQWRERLSTVVASDAE